MWLVSRAVSLYKQVMDETKEFFIRVLMGILIFLGYVLLSLFIYAVIRRIMVPQKLHIIPVHLQYNSKCLGQAAVDGTLTCSFPQAEFLLNNGGKLLRSGQYYRVAVEIEMPEKDLNLEAGVFMVNLTFYTTHQRFLATSARPTAIRYRSTLLRTLFTLVFALPLLLGLWEQKQTLEVVLFDNYYEPYGDGALSAKVFLESNKVQLYSTTMTVDANFTGFTYYLYQWPVSMTVIVVISILITLCTCTVLIWVRDVLNDFEERRAMRLQRRRGMIQQRGGARGEHRSAEQRRDQQSHHRAADARPGAGVQAAETLTSGEESSGQGTATPADTRDSSEIRDTESEVSGLSDMISNLHSLRREMDSDDISSTGTDTPTRGQEDGGEEETPPQAGEQEGRTLETGELRRRTGNLN